jgi:hypothetical protein
VTTGSLPRALARRNAIVLLAAAGRFALLTALGCATSTPRKQLAWRDEVRAFCDANVTNKAASLIWNDPLSTRESFMVLYP